MLGKIHLAPVFLCVALIGSMACHKHHLPDTLKLTHHGYLYIACASPPYYLNLDSLTVYGATLGPLPDALPAFNLAGATDVDYVSYDEQRDRLGSGENYDILVSFDPYPVTIQSNLPDAVAQDIPVNIEGTVYQAGEHPYLGGYRFTTDQLETTIRVVNAYVGGCYHNMVVWEVKR